MSSSFSKLIAGTSVGLLIGLSCAYAGAPLTIGVDRSQLMQLNAEPGTIIVGNPSIADVSLNGRQLFIHGHSAGETNLMVFDQGGNKIADYDLSVAQDGANSLIVFTGSSTAGTMRLSYVCAPNCERSMVAGDNSEAFSKILGVNQAKSSFAQGSKASGSAQPAQASAPAQ